MFLFVFFGGGGVDYRYIICTTIVGQKVKYTVQKLCKFQKLNLILTFDLLTPNHLRCSSGYRQHMRQVSSSSCQKMRYCEEMARSSKSEYDLDI